MQPTDHAGLVLYPDPSAGRQAEGSGYETNAGWYSIRSCSSPKTSSVGVVTWYSVQLTTRALEYTSLAAAGLQVPRMDQPLSLAA